MTLKHVMLAASLVTGDAAFANVADDIRTDERKVVDEARSIEQKGAKLEKQGATLVDKGESTSADVEKRGGTLKAKGKRMEKAASTLRKRQ